MYIAKASIFTSLDKNRSWPGLGHHWRWSEFLWQYSHLAEREERMNSETGHNFIDHVLSLSSLETLPSMATQGY